MKKVLIVSPHFPPGSAPDMQRVRMSLPHYRENGWDPVVLAVGAAWQGTVLEPALSDALPPDTRFVFTRALPLRWSRFFGVGNLGLRAWLFLFWRGTQLLRREKFDLVFFSTTQFMTFTLGPRWKRRFGIPYVLDVQDPWRTDYYERPGSRRPPGGRKYAFARLQARAFEGGCFSRAAALMSVSPLYLQALRSRYPGLASTPADVLPFGASRADLAQAARLPRPEHPFPRESGQRHLLYTGASGPVTPHALTVLFTALRLYRERTPERARRLRFHFIGTSYAAPGQGRPSVLPLAEGCGVADQVVEIPHRVGYLEAIRLQQEADALLLLGSSDLAYSPSKAYVYYLTGRPLLGLVFRDSVMEGLLDEFGCAFMVRFREAEPRDEAWAGLHRFFDQVIEAVPSPARSLRDSEQFKNHFLAEGLTRRQCALFDRAVDGK